MQTVEFVLVVEDHRIGHRQSQGARTLAAQHAIDDRVVPAVAGAHAAALGGLAAVHHHHAVQLDPPARRFGEQGNVEHDASLVALRNTLRDVACHDGVNDGFQCVTGAGVCEHVFAHAGAVQRAVAVDERGPEAVQQGGDGRAAGRRAGAGDGIGIDEVSAERLQARTDRAFAAADAAREADAPYRARQPHRPTAARMAAGPNTMAVSQPRARKGPKGT